MIGSANESGQHVWVACGKPPPSRYIANGGEGSGRSRLRTLLDPVEDVRLGTAHGCGDGLEIAWVTREYTLAQRRAEEDDVRVHHIAVKAMGLSFVPLMLGH